jgi:hypothetical protein
MRFFVPFTNNLRHAEELYRKLRDQLTADGSSLSERRIYRLKYEQEGHQQNAAVGSDRQHGFGHGPVLAIFESDNGVHYICTAKEGGLAAEPHPMPSSTVREVEEFSAEA